VNSGGFRGDTWQSLRGNTRMDFEYRRAARSACLRLLLLFIYLFICLFILVSVKLDFVSLGSWLFNDALATCSDLD
jgi:hypothetical protein